MQEENARKARLIAWRVRQVAAAQEIRGAAGIGKRAKIAGGHMSKLMRGLLPWSDEMLFRIATAFGVTAEFLEHGAAEESLATGNATVYDTGEGGSWRAGESSREYGLGIPQDIRGFCVRGDLVEPLAQDGQVVFVLPKAPTEDGGLAYVELQDGTATIRRVYFDGKHYVLVAINPDYAPLLVDATDLRHRWPVWGIKI